ncbi:zinc finger protein CONSTANS-like [Amaranthus tricolor]|uniref:zinc finger protein CONSTANS-like n=1 Tax=Amaranthus tricolor TaxID=29722 RepID=UPI0025893AFF|nr:zinc finger protein CONSTANS-like [Amaranthus tricolor]
MRVKKKCELCSNLATIYCESDQAILCYECDSKVHGANFLVAKHSRILLCHVCQSPTIWSGSGPKFGPTVSVCPPCLVSKPGVARNQLHRDVNNNRTTTTHQEEEEEEEDDDDDDDDVDDDDGDDDDDDDDEDGNNGFHDDDDEENQVVPWSYSASHPR